MKLHRTERISKLIMEYLNEIIIREIELPNVMATITAVDVAKDHSRAIVRVSVLPSDKSAGVVKTLNHTRGRLQYQLQRKINIRPMPKIIFEVDKGPEQAAAVEKALLNK
ncbi:MAG: 30S ribosome-binding factor RbfA [bacterium]|nr:30S ribosome-binding factor RbfA [bacterium]